MEFGFKLPSSPGLICCHKSVFILLLQQQCLVEMWVCDFFWLRFWFWPLYTGYTDNNTSYIIASYFWQDGPHLSPPTKMADVWVVWFLLRDKHTPSNYKMHEHIKSLMQIQSGVCLSPVGCVFFCVLCVCVRPMPFYQIPGVSTRELKRIL